MPRGDKSKYSAKQKRMAEHIEEGYESRGVGENEAERRAWATVNKDTGGGELGGSGAKRKRTSSKRTTKRASSKKTTKRAATKRAPAKRATKRSPSKRATKRSPSKRTTKRTAKRTTKRTIAKRAPKRKKKSS